ncbi:hypothetical protein E4U54_002268 [Claviceps lovelessii]|nr:hypothetical protein E4U54_002268 [Claviceps lovelessii]
MTWQADTDPRLMTRLARFPKQTPTSATNICSFTKKPSQKPSHLRRKLVDCVSGVHQKAVTTTTTTTTPGTPSQTVSFKAYHFPHDTGLRPLISTSNMEQVKALDALEPFLALSKSAVHPRAAADLITQATSAPNTYVFAELLEQPHIQALSTNEQYASHLKLLQIFSYGTYKGYHDEAASLPALNEAQALKLRQLSVLSLARDRRNLYYDVLQNELGLSSAREVEELVITAIYAGLIQGTLDPDKKTIQVTSLAPLRDLEPACIPDMIVALNHWSDRCTSTLSDLEGQIQSIRATALKRENEKRATEMKIQALVADAREAEKMKKGFSCKDALVRRGFNKRSILDAANPAHDETMDLGEPSTTEDQQKRSSKRKM